MNGPLFNPDGMYGDFLELQASPPPAPPIDSADAVLPRRQLLEKLIGASGQLAEGPLRLPAAGNAPVVPARAR